MMGSVRQTKYVTSAKLSKMPLLKFLRKRQFEASVFGENKNAANGSVAVKTHTFSYR